MNVCRYINLFGPWAPPHGGVATYMRDLCKNLDKSGYKTRVFGYGRFAPTNNLYKIYFSSYKWPLTLLKIIRHVSAGDILHNNSTLVTYPESHYLKSFLYILRIKKIRRVETLHDPSFVSRFKRFSEDKKRLVIKYLAKADRIIVDHNNIKQFLVSKGLDEKMIEFIPPLLPKTMSVGELTGYKDISNFFETHKPVIMSIGAFHPWYDFYTIIKSFIKLREVYNKAGLIIVFSNFTIDPKYKKSTKMLIDSVSDDILLTSELPENILLTVLKKSSLMIRGAMEGESFGLCKIESILMGTPVITTKAGETRFMVSYKYKNTEDLYKKIIAVLDGDVKIDMRAAQTFFKEMANENFRRITNIYQDIQCS